MIGYKQIDLSQFVRKVEIKMPSLYAQYRHTTPVLYEQLTAELTTTGRY